MRRADIMRRAARNLRQAKGRTFLTSLAIAVGAFTITASLAGGEGARQYADKLIKSNVDPQSVDVMREDMTNRTTTSGGLQKYDPDASFYGGTSIKMLNEEDITTLSKLDGVQKVIPTYLVDVKYVTFEGSDQKYTTDVTTYDATIRSETAAGSLPEIGAQIGTTDAVVPQSFADELGVSAEQLVGKVMTLHLERAAKTPTDDELKKAYASGGSAAAQALFETELKNVSLVIRAVTAKSNTSFATMSALYVSDTQAKNLTDFLYEGTDRYRQYVSATVLVKDGMKPDTVKAAIEEKGMYAMTAQDLSGMIFTMVNVLQGIVLGFGVLALIASVFGIINTQYISVLERTSQIGLMKALGMPRRDVAKLFRYEAAWIGFIGGVLGAALAYGAGTVLNPWITKTLTLGDGNYLLIFIWWHIALLIVGLMLVAIVAGWLPSRKAAKLDPIDALRTE